MKIDKTCMTYWFPLLEKAEIPVPKTKFLEMPIDLCESVLMVLYGENPKLDPRTHPFIDELKSVVQDMGTPCFLRTGQTSAKHSWEDSCFIANQEDVLKHVYQIAEFSELAQLCGLPFNKWFVREMLPSVKFGVCPRYGNLPIAREFRFFVGNGEVRCFHPYWPLEPLKYGGWTGTEEDFERLSTAGKDEPEIRDLAVRVSRAIEGEWSVDILQTDRGWYVTDMAEAHRSFHWDGCSEVNVGVQ